MKYTVWKAVRAIIFSELYSAYYNTVANILKSAVEHPLQTDELRSIVNKHAFGESILNILPSIQEERWQLVNLDGTTPIKNVPSMPLTKLQKRWLKAIGNDPRIRLFADQCFDFPDVEPLFLQEDILVFDKYLDGDDYENEAYIQNFRLILDAIKNKYPVIIEQENRRRQLSQKVILPEYLEYSEKDDKFRMVGSGCRLGNTVNLGRIISCKRYDEPYEISSGKRNLKRPRRVIFELIDYRNALERVLMHFAHFKKQAEKLDEKRYRVTVYYDKEDEMEMVIRILSFGPMLKVVAPQNFINLIKQRLMDQKSCEL